jgi:hypothetical protein
MSEKSRSVDGQEVKSTRNVLRRSRTLSMVALSSLAASVSGGLISGCGGSSSGNSASSAPKSPGAPKTPVHALIPTRTRETHSTTPQPTTSSEIKASTPLTTALLGVQQRTISSLAILSRSEAATALGNPSSSNTINIYDDYNPQTVTERAATLYTAAPSYADASSPQGLSYEQIRISGGPWSGPTSPEPNPDSPAEIAQQRTLLTQEGFTPAQIASQIARTEAAYREDEWFTKDGYAVDCRAATSPQTTLNPGQIECDMFKGNVHVEFVMGGSPYLDGATTDEKQTQARYLVSLVLPRINAADVSLP